MSSRASKAEALRQLRERRERGIGSALNDYEIKDEGDIYEKVDEEEYRDLVEKRREREDFVVDDDGLGYHDDGEEVVFYGDEDDTSKQRKKRSGKTAALTDDVLRKARKTNALLKEKERTDSSKTNNMWGFVKTGADISTIEKKYTRDTYQKQASTNAGNLSDLLDILDEDDTATHARSHKRAVYGRAGRSMRSPAAGARSFRSSFGRRSGSTSTPRHSNSIRQSSALRNRTPSRSHQNDIPEDEYEHDEEPIYEVDQHDKANVNLDVEMENAHDEEESDEKPTFPKEDDVATTIKEESTKDSKQEPLEEEKPKPVPSIRKRLAFASKSSSAKLSGPAQAALEKQKQQNAKPTPAPKPVPTPMSKSASFQVNSNTNAILAEGDGSAYNPAAAAAAAANLESVLQTHTVQTKTESDEEENSEAKEESYNYVDMFWMDAKEQNDKIYLFGKVKVPSENDNGTKTASSRDAFVSCCAIVNNNLRNLYVLPRVSEDGQTRVNMLDVHTEINSILKPSCIPNVEGASWAGKRVTRKYAFEDATVPKEETEYLKVVYDAKYPTPPEDVCQGGKHFQRIFGAGATVLESFIIKRRLMGPCWVRVKNPSPSNLSLSWCKIEFQLDSPKDVKRLDLVDVSLNKPPPPITTVAFKFKTIINPSTHKAEIVALSAICHKETLLDTASDESFKFMTQLSLIRPLGNSIPDGTNIPKTFPRDFEAVVKQNMPQLQKMTNERALLSRFFAQIGSWDPDVLVGHNAFGYDLEVILNRCIDLKVPTWSKLGRRKRMQIPQKNTMKSDWAIQEAITGRILCDTYLSSKELLRETTYSLSNLAATQLKAHRLEVDPVDVPMWFQNSQDIVRLAQHTLNDAQLVQRLMFKLQILPLTKQLTCIAGNLWSKTIKGNRADRNEYLLLHEFHQLKYIVPEKKKGKADKGAKFSGGLVLEPKKGLYDSFILLLDFNSLYPSIIQEYNLCFTTVEWSNHLAQMKDVDEAEKDPGATSSLAPLPEETSKRGILPRVIKTLVERRKNVKKMIKQEKNSDKLEEVRNLDDHPCITFNIHSIVKFRETHFLFFVSFVFI